MFKNTFLEKIIQINNEAFPENTNKATKFGLAMFKGICVLFLTLRLSIKTDEKGLQMQINFA